MNTSQLGKINFKDLLNGLALAVISAVLIKLADMIGLGFSNINFNELLRVAAAVGISYLIQALSINSQGQLLTAEPFTEEVVE